MLDTPLVPHSVQRMLFEVDIKVRFTLWPPGGARPPHGHFPLLSLDCVSFTTIRPKLNENTTKTTSIHTTRQPVRRRQRSKVKGQKTCLSYEGLPLTCSHSSHHGDDRDHQPPPAPGCHGCRREDTLRRGPADPWVLQAPGAQGPLLST